MFRCKLPNYHSTVSDIWLWYLCTAGSPRYRILPLHSQIPREDQRRVFEQVPPDVTKVTKCSDTVEVVMLRLVQSCYYSDMLQLHFARLWLGVAFAARRLNVCRAEEVVIWHDANRRSNTQLRKGCTYRRVAVCFVVWVSTCRWNGDRSPPSIDIFKSSRFFVSAAVTWSSYSLLCFGRW